MMKYVRYPEYKDSGVAWLGEVPGHWGVRRIKYVAPLRNIKILAGESDLSYIGLENIESWSGRYVVQDESNDSEGLSSRFFSSDVLFGKLRPYLAKAFLSNFEGICSSEFLVLQVKGIQSHFLVRFVLSVGFIKEVDSSTYGAKMPRASWEFIGNLPITFPPTEEQSTIATFLDKETTQIDQLIEKKTRFIELLKEKRAALITEAVTGKFDVRTGKPYAEYKDSGVEWLGGVPVHWEVRRLKFVASYQNSNVDKKSYAGQKNVRLCNYTDVYYNEKITNNMDFMMATATDAEIKSMRLKEWDVVITKDSEDPADIGIPALVSEPLDNVVCGYHLTILRAKATDVARYLHRAIQSHPTRGHFFVESPGITRFGLNQDAIGDLVISVPPTSERKCIADYISHQATQIDQLIENTQQSISLLKEKRAALITAAVTGKIDVRDFNPKR